MNELRGRERLLASIAVHLANRSGERRTVRAGNIVTVDPRRYRKDAEALLDALEVYGYRVILQRTKKFAAARAA